MKNTLAITTGIIIGILGVGFFLLIIAPQRGEPIILLPAPTPAPISVHITGAVAFPGLYELPDGSRVHALIQEAGGFLDEANAESLNLASFLIDGSELHVPYIGEGRSNVGQTGTADPSAQSPTIFPININSASLADLELLDGIGPMKAQNIINYREENGPFERIGDIQNVPDIGPVTFNNIKDLITVD